MMRLASAVEEVMGTSTRRYRPDVLEAFAALRT